MMNRLDLWIVIASLIGLVIFLMAHILIFRYKKPKGVERTIQISFALGILADVGSMLVWGGASSWPLLGLGVFMSLAIFAMCFFNYMSLVFGMGEVAIRVRLIREIDARPTGSATLEELYQKYNTDMILTARLARLTAAGYLRLENNYYRIQSRLLFLHSHLLKTIRTLMGLR